MQIAIKTNGAITRTFTNEAHIPQNYRLPGFDEHSFFGDWECRGIAFYAARHPAVSMMTVLTGDGSKLSMNHVAAFRDGGEMILRPGYTLRYTTEESRITVEIICSP